MSTFRIAETAVSRRSVLAGFGAIAGTAFLAACGSSDSSDSKGSSGSGGAGKLTTVRVAGIPAASLSAFKLAVADGAFKKAGLDIQYKEYADQTAVYTAYRAGGADIGLGGIPAVANLVASGVDRKVLFALQKTRNPMLVRADSGITKVEDLKGKKIGLFGTAIGSSTNQFFVMCREWFGFDPVTECKIQYGAPDLMAELVSKGELDMSLTVYPAGAARVVSGEFISLGDTGMIIEEKMGAEAFTAGWDVDTKWYEANKKAAEAYIKVNLEYQTRFNNDQSLWDSALKNLYKITDQGILDLIFENQKGSLVEKWGPTEIAGSLALVEFLSKNGEKDFLPKVPDNLFIS